MGDFLGCANVDFVKDIVYLGPKVDFYAAQTLPTLTRLHVPMPANRAILRYAWPVYALAGYGGLL
jgi:hypothetical protein